jgi:hypothetical protein
MSLADCLKAADETKELILEKNALERLPTLLHEYYSCDAVFLVADENTYEAAGNAPGNSLRNKELQYAATISSPVLPGFTRNMRISRRWLRASPRCRKTPCRWSLAAAPSMIW